MFVGPYLSKMKTFQNTLLTFLRKEDSSESDLSNIIKVLDDLQIRENRGNFKTILHMLLKLSDAFGSNQSIIHKIEQILINLQNDIQNFFSNDEIFIIFQRSKKILYFLITNKILTVNMFIAKRMISDQWFTSRNYPEFFYLEIKPFFNKVDEISEKIQENFEEKRKFGVNDNFVCEVIRSDSIQKFKNISFLYY